MKKLYRDYFSIDENYFPSVNKEVLESGAVEWKKFYPHDTFVKLLYDVESVLSRKQKQSIWVEGAYGTGKSHAVLTLKKILDATDYETKAYFEKYELSTDLYNKLKGAKNQGKILTVHIYGSASIFSDRDLIMAIQESIKKTLIEEGIQNKGEVSLKESVIKWLSDDANKNYFNALINRDHALLFEGDNVDSIINKLNMLNDQEVTPLLNRVFRVADEARITAFKLDIAGLILWIKKVINSNDLKAIVFIWDEFTEYFDNNKNALTGFQQLVELSATNPFYMIIVTHKSEGLFHDTDNDKKKILDRFIKPTCNIELPENMAFKLMGAAMEKKEDPALLSEWQSDAEDLNSRLKDSRTLVMNQANISSDELKDILPIHPFTALLLKHLSTAFDSNQRSMFDFIKNNRGDNVKGFQWFIENYGPLDDWNLLTIDMLWDFFYEKGKEHLSPEVRSILDSYSRQKTQEFTEDEQKVFKTILLLQSISQKVGDSVELFIPNDKNLSNAYDGTELESGRAVSIANKLVREEVLYKKQTGLNKFQYSTMINTGDSTAIEKFKKEFLNNKKTQDLITEGSLENILILTGALKLRYVIRTASVDNFKRVVNELKNQESKYENNIVAVITYAKNETESTALVKMIKEYSKVNEGGLVFIDTSLTPLGIDGFEQYVDHMANSCYQRGKDNSLANQYESLAKEVLNKWKDKIILGEFFVYSNATDINGRRYFSIDDVCEELRQINFNKYQLGIENYKVIENMFVASSLALGAQCGAKQETSGTFRSANVATKLENALDGAWGLDNYWISNSSLLISKIKIFIEEEIHTAFNNDGKVSIFQLYNKLKAVPYGFMPCNLTAFIFGFVLKEYANDTYRWSDGQISDNMSPEKLKEMIKEIIDLQSTPSNRHKEKFIVTMTEEERAFTTATSKIFNIPENQCASIEQMRDRLRSKMKELSFPIWCTKEMLSSLELSVPKKIVENMITAYIGVANSLNISSSKTELDIALEIGKQCINSPNVVEDLVKLFTKENCRNGMIEYLKNYDKGQLVKLSDEIGDAGSYINVLKQKFDAAEANWVWNIETANKKIQEVILEYSIIAESNKYNTKMNTYEETLREWCDKLNFVRIPYDVIKNDVDDIKLFLEALYSLKRTGMISDVKKIEFLQMLQTKEKSFYEFWQSQNTLFKKVASFYLEGLTDEQAEDVMKKIPSNVFIKDKSEYYKIVESTVNDFKNKLGKEKLREIWREKTGTGSPREWSTKYLTPLMCMIEKDEDNARKFFAYIDSKNPSEYEVRLALDYIDKADIFDKLNSAEQRDKCFLKRLVKDYVTVLSDADDVRKHLINRVTADVYDWYQSGEVERKIKEFAEYQYMAGGSEKALRKIEEMEPDKLKTYLKDLIRNNIMVGIEIINDN
jgi:hypothetical protein